MKNTIFVFDQAEEPGGSVDRIIEVMNSLEQYNFIFATKKPLCKLTSLKINSNIKHVRIRILVDGPRAANQIARFTKINKAIGGGISLFYKVLRKFDYFQRYLQLKSISRRYQIDLIQSNSDIHGVPFMLARILDVPLLSFMRSQIDFNWWSENDINKCSKFICVSNALKEYYSNHLPVPKEKLKTIHSPFNSPLKLSTIKSQQLPEEVVTMLNSSNITACHTARFCPDKGQFDVVKALKNLKDFGLKLNVIFIGPFESSPKSRDYQKAVFNYVEAHNLQDQVTFLGMRADALYIMSKCHFFIHTATYFEGLGGTVIEAIQLGKFVVASKFGGPLETIIEGETGMFYEINNVTSLTKCLEKLIKGEIPVVSESNINRLLLKFSPDEICSLINHEYSLLLKQKNAPPNQ